MSTSSVFESARGERGVSRGGMALGVLALLVACSSDSFLVVKMLAPAGTSVDNIAFLQVTASNDSGRMTPMLMFNTPRASNGTMLVSLDDTVGKDFSLQFTSGERGPVNLVVSAFSPSCGCLAEGKVTEVPLNRGATANVQVTMFPTSTCTNSCVPSGATGGQGGTAATGGRAGSGGGAAGAGGRGGSQTGGTGTGGGMTFPGCNPAVASTCGAGQTCQVDCGTKTGVCVVGGSLPHGSICKGNEDCAPGSQCFDFGCGVKTCLAFCGSDAQCASTAGALCIDPVECTDVTTAYSTCSSPCDPRGAATQGCAAGLNCFLFAYPRSSEVVPNCRCSGTERVRTEGQPCTTSDDCRAGTVCNSKDGNKVCRALCKPGTTTDCGQGKSCQMVLASSVYGVCM